MILTLEQIRQQLRFDDDYVEEDGFLMALAKAVEARTANYLNRTLYPGTPPDTDPDGLQVSEDIIQGMLMLVTFYFENRSSMSDIEMNEIPLGYKWLVDPYRFIPL